MRIVLNDFTNTAHRPSHEDSSHPAACGALRHVSSDHIRVLADENESDGEVDRCGRCFDDSGGY